ncbi:integrin [Streptomyces sp. AS58]|uniref:integrin alpha n=1 Tax=Streptomyces sp. AS58 TaxID=1519489 RepID=UPI0006ADEEDA|nr:integrin alpha [Streptomyces sp. AS58]KOV50720.1 integrin [Streptomyces sp. AS58]
MLLVAAGSTFAATIGVVSLPSQQAAAAACTAGTFSDFNGDGVTDTAIGDPNATVNGVKGAGLVRVVLGADKGVAEISQATTGMAGLPERNDQFGFSVTTYDADTDGCSDLVVGTPNEDIVKDGKQLVDAGAVYVIHGTPTGIGAGSTIKGYHQEELDASVATEAYDWFGYAVKAGTTASSVPYLAIGVPGEDVTYEGKKHTDAGTIEYVQGTSVVPISQKDPGVAGGVEVNDRFGYSLAGTNRYFAVGAPGEAIGPAKFAGGVSVFSHTLSDGLPTPLVGLNQDVAGVSQVAEAGDGFATSIAMTNYRPSNQTYNSDVLLAIGSPGEDIGTTSDAGYAAVYRIQPSGAFTEHAVIDASPADVEGNPVAGDFLGQRVTVANTDTTVVTTSATVRLAVGIPGKDTATAKDAGAVQVFRPLDTNVGAADKMLFRGAGLPGTAAVRDYNGIALMSTASSLYTGVPYSKASDSTKGVLYVTPWSDIDGTTSTGTTTYKPGSGGLPDAGESFGRVG